MTIYLPPFSIMLGDKIMHFKRYGIVHSFIHDPNSVFVKFLMTT